MLTYDNYGLIKIDRFLLITKVMYLNIFKLFIFFKSYFVIFVN